MVQIPIDLKVNHFVSGHGQICFSQIISVTQSKKFRLIVVFPHFAKHHFPGNHTERDTNIGKSKNSPHFHGARLNF